MEDKMFFRFGRHCISWLSIVEINTDYDLYGEHYVAIVTREIVMGPSGTESRRHFFKFGTPAAAAIKKWVDGQSEVVC